MRRVTTVLPLPWLRSQVPRNVEFWISTACSCQNTLIIGRAIQYHAQPSASNSNIFPMLRALVNHLVPEVFLLHQQPFLPHQQHHPGVHCQGHARGRDCRSGGSHGPGDYPSGVKCHRARTTICGALGTSCLPVTCKSGTTIGYSST